MATFALNLWSDVTREGENGARWTNKAERCADFNKSRISEVEGAEHELNHKNLS